MNKVVGIGVLLQTNDSTYLFQERDLNTDRYPGRITPFGGGIENNEDIFECAKRELFEELELSVDTDKLKLIDCFESQYKPGTDIQMFTLKEIDKSGLQLREGTSIIELSLEEALQHDKVTNFTKKVLGSL